MADKKITQLTQVTTLPNDALLTAVDDTRAAGDKNVAITKQNLANDIGGDASFDVEVNQVAHGLSIGDVIQHNGTAYVAANAATEADADAIGIVTTVTDVDNFTYTYGGLIATNLGLSNGDSGFLQDDGSIGTTSGTINLFLGTQTPQGFLIKIGQGFVTGDSNAGVGVREVDSSVTSTKNLDLDAFNKWNLTMTGATTFTFTNIPTGDAVKVVEVLMSGDFTENFPQVTFDPDSDTYDGLLWNRYTFTVESDIIRGFIKNLESVV